MYNWDDHARRIQAYVDKAIGKALGAVGINQRTIDAEVLRGELDSSIVLPAHAPEHEAGGADEIDLGALAGTLEVEQFGTQSANRFPGGPASGVPGAVSWRALVAADIPELAASKIAGVAVVGGGNGAANQVAFFTDTGIIDGDAGFTFDQATGEAYISGKLGIGTAPTSSSYLNILGNTNGNVFQTVKNSSNGTSARSAIYVQNDLSAGLLFMVTSSLWTLVAGWGNQAVLRADNSINGIRLSALNGIYLSVAGTATDDLVVEATTGDVGIGTAAPGAHVDVFKPTGGVMRLSRDDTSVNINDTLGVIEFWGGDSQLTTQNIFANIEARAQATIASNAAFSKLLFRTTGPGAGTSPVERLALGLVKSLTDAATSLFDISVTAGEMCGGTILWTIVASNGTEHQSYSGITTYAVINKAGAYTTQITHNTANDSKSLSSGTLTATWGVLNGTNKVTIQVTPAGSLTETTYQIFYSLHANGSRNVTVL